MLRIQELGLDRVEKLQNIIPTTESANCSRTTQKFLSLTKLITCNVNGQTLVPSDAMVFMKNAEIIYFFDAASKIATQVVKFYPAITSGTFRYCLVARQ